MRLTRKLHRVSEYLDNKSLFIKAFEESFKTTKSEIVLYSILVCLIILSMCYTAYKIGDKYVF